LLNKLNKIYCKYFSYYAYITRMYAYVRVNIENLYMYYFFHQNVLLNPGLIYGKRYVE